MVETGLQGVYARRSDVAPEQNPLVSVAYDVMYLMEFSGGEFLRRISRICLAWGPKACLDGCTHQLSSAIST